MPKKIALVTLDYPPEKGGVARYLGNLVDVSHGMIDVFVNEEHETTGPGAVTSVPFFWPFWPRWMPLIKFFRSIDKDVYGHVFISHVLPVGTAAWLAKKWGGLDYSILLHGLDVRLAFTSRQRTWVMKRVLRGAKTVFVNSQFVAEEVKRVDGSLHPVVVTPGVETLTFPERSIARERRSVSADDFLLLCVARLVPRKGVDRAIELLAHLPSHVRLVVVGNGSDRERLKMLAEPFGARVQFVFESTDEERNEWYAAADLFLFLPKEEVTDVEGFGIVCLEAAAAGLPVIVARSGGATETVVHNVTGFVVDATQPHQVVHGIQRLMNDPERAQRMGEAGRRRVLQDFQWEDRWRCYQSCTYER